MQLRGKDAEQKLRKGLMRMVHAKLAASFGRRHQVANDMTQQH